MKPIAGLPCVLVLASGRGRRFTASGGQGNKLDALLDGTALIDHVMRAVVESGLPWHVERQDHAGMGDTIAAAVQHNSSASGWLVLPADLPRIRARTLIQIAKKLADWPVVVPTWQGERGHPVGFSAACRGQLVALHGERGAAAIVAAHGERGQVLWVEQGDPGCLQDVDTAQRLQALQSGQQLKPGES